MTLPTMVGGLTRDDLLGWSRRIDAGPFSTLAAGERVSFPNPEILVALAGAAAVTERVRIAATVFVLPMHASAWLAKQTATLDVLSAGGSSSGSASVGARRTIARSARPSSAATPAWTPRSTRCDGSGRGSRLRRGSHRSDPRPCSPGARRSGSAPRASRRGPARALAARCGAAGAAAVRELLAALRDAGADEVLLVPTAKGLAELERTLDLVG